MIDCNELKFGIHFYLLLMECRGTVGQASTMPTLLLTSPVDEITVGWTQSPTGCVATLSNINSKK